jgi:ABC-type polysaccharide/polyol phosphate transport system ATPase subunit
MSVLRIPTCPPGEPLVELRGVSRRFDKHSERNRSLQELFIQLFRRRQPTVDVFWPVRDLSLTINPGDSVGIIGPNGSGKSTLLKLITGILIPTGGELVVRGRVSSLLELGAGFNPDLTGRDNIFLNGSIYGLSRAEMNQRLDKIVAYAGLGDFIDTPVKHYSSGMYVRLGFAVAIHTDPDLLLVDEVLAVGDAVFQAKCMESIYRFRQAGGTLLLVSHDLNAIQSLCTRALWLEDGFAAADGNPTDVVMAYKQHIASQENGNPAQSTPSDRQRWGTGEVQITQVEICDGDGRLHSHFMTGDALLVRLHYTSRVRVEQPTFGIAIHHQNGAHLFGPNTQFDGLEIPVVEGDGVVTYRIPHLPLLEGHYNLTAAVVNQSDTVIFDYHDRIYNFQVIHSPVRTGYGLVQIAGVWQHEAEAADGWWPRPRPRLTHEPGTRASHPQP